MLFEDRIDAGRQLAAKLSHYANRPEVIVLALPRGGVPVAYEVAVALKAPLDVFLVRKLGAPSQRELAMGAIASGGVRVLNDDVVNYLGIPEEVIDRVAEEEMRELYRREREYRGARAMENLQDRIVILVDDGLATGSTMRAAIKALHQFKPAKIVVGVPVSAPETCAEFEQEVDEIICVQTPQPFRAVGLWYRDFSQTTDDEVRTLLARANQLTRHSAA